MNTQINAENDSKLRFKFDLVFQRKTEWDVGTRLP